MAYADIQNKVGQIRMANHVLLAKSRKDRDDARKKKKDKINLRKQQDKIKADEKKRLKEDSEYYRGQDPNAKIYNRDGQEVLNDGSIVRDEDMRTGGPIIDPNTLLQIGGAIGGGVLPLIQQLLIRNPNAMASGFPYDFEGGVVTPRYFTPPRYRQQPFLHIRTKDITDEELFHFNNFIKSMGGGLDTVKKRTPLSIAKLPHSPPVEKMVVGNKLMDSPLRFRSDADRIRLMEDYAKGFRYDGT